MNYNPKKTKTMTTNEIRDYRRLIAEQSTCIDFTKDFDKLRPCEITELLLLYKAFNFNGKNNLGRSLARQFYYYLQKGKLPF